MFYTELDGNAEQALVSASRKSAVAKARAHIARGGTATVTFEHAGVRMPDADAERMLMSHRPSSNGKYSPDIDLHNSLEKLAIYAHQCATQVLRKNLTEEQVSTLYELCGDVQAAISE